MIDISVPCSCMLAPKICDPICIFEPISAFGGSRRVLFCPAPCCFYYYIFVFVSFFSLVHFGLFFSFYKYPMAMFFYCHIPM